MSEFKVLIRSINAVTQHPNRDRLDLVTVSGGFNCISAKKSDGSPRYAVGDLVAYMPVNAILPEAMLRCGFWDAEKDKGGLAGGKGNRVKAFKIGGEQTEGILFSVFPYAGYDEGAHYVLSERFPDVEFVEGMDVTALLGITEFKP